MPPCHGWPEVGNTLPSGKRPAPQGGASLHRLPYPGRENAGSTAAAPDRERVASNGRGPAGSQRCRHEDLCGMPPRGPVQTDPGGHAERGKKPRQHPPCPFQQGRFPLLPDRMRNVPRAAKEKSKPLPRGQQRGTRGLVFDRQGRAGDPRGVSEATRLGALEALDQPLSTCQGRRRALHFGSAEGPAMVRRDALRLGRETHRPRARGGKPPRGRKS